jgi:hypothetical protein
LISLTEFLDAITPASTGSIAPHPFRQLIFQIGIAKICERADQ